MNAIQHRVLTEEETSDTFESWRNQLIACLSQTSSFAAFLKPGATWPKKRNALVFRGYTGADAAPKAALLDIMLCHIANLVPVLSRHSITKNSTSLDSIWEAIRQYYGIQAHRARDPDVSAQPSPSTSHAREPVHRTMAAAAARDEYALTKSHGDHPRDNPEGHRRIVAHHPDYDHHRFRQSSSNNPMCMRTQSALNVLMSIGDESADTEADDDNTDNEDDVNDNYYLSEDDDCDYIGIEDDNDNRKDDCDYNRKDDCDDNRKDDCDDNRKDDGDDNRKDDGDDNRKDDGDDNRKDDGDDNRKGDGDDNRKDDGDNNRTDGDDNKKDGDDNRKGDGDDNRKDDGDDNRKDDGDDNRKDDCDDNRKDDGDDNRKDDGDNNRKDDGDNKRKDDGDDKRKDDGDDNRKDDGDNNRTDGDDNKKDGDDNRKDDGDDNMDEDIYIYNRKDDGNYNMDEDICNYNRKDNDDSLIDDCKFYNRNNHADYIENYYEAFEYNQDNDPSDCDNENNFGDHELMPDPSHVSHSIAHEECTATAVNYVVIEIMRIDSHQELMTVPAVADPCSTPAPCDHTNIATDVPHVDGEVHGAVQTSGNSGANPLLHWQESRDMSSPTQSVVPKHLAHSEPRRKDRRARHRNLCDLHTIVYSCIGCAPNTHYNHLTPQTVILAQQDNVRAERTVSRLQASIDTIVNLHHGARISVVCCAFKTGL
jgi:hypothetical protein